MHRDMLFKKICSFLVNDMNVTAEIKMNSHLKDDLLIDSLEMADLIFFVEDLIEQEILPEEFPRLYRINEIIDFIDDKIDKEVIQL